MFEINYHRTHYQIVTVIARPDEWPVFIASEQEGIDASSD